jgi:hypothetical protein
MIPTATSIHYQWFWSTNHYWKLKLRKLLGKQKHQQNQKDNTKEKTDNGSPKKENWKFWEVYSGDPDAQANRQMPWGIGGFFKRKTIKVLANEETQVHLAIESKQRAISCTDKIIRLENSTER